MNIEGHYNTQAFKPEKKQQLRSIKYSMSPRLKQTTQGNILFWMLFERGQKENTSWLALITVVEREIERFFWSGHGSANVQRRDVGANAFGVVLHSDIPLFTPIRLILKQETGTEGGSCLDGVGEDGLSGRTHVSQGALHFKGRFLLFYTDPYIALRLETSAAHPSPAVTLIVEEANTHLFWPARWYGAPKRRASTQFTSSGRAPVIVRLFATVLNNISWSQVLSHTPKDKMEPTDLFFAPSSSWLSKRVGGGKKKSRIQKRCRSLLRVTSVWCCWRR